MGDLAPVPADRPRRPDRRLPPPLGRGLLRSALVSAALWGLCVFASAVLACSVPTFRYALEHWEPDKYELVVFHRGNLRPQQKAVVAALSRRGANLRVLDVDADSPRGPEEEPVRLGSPPEESRLPWAVLLCPRSFGTDAALWEGPLDNLDPSTLLDSPARKSIARRILQGDCAVWVFLESGDPGKDDPAARLLKAQLAGLEESLRLPEIDPDKVGAPAGGAPLKLRIAFSMLRIGREGRGEALLRDILLRSEGGLAEHEGPMAFPVFGRGHVLYALVGTGINERNVAEACAFIVGSCSCIAKERNPGVDLLMSVDWDGMLAGKLISDECLPPLVGLPSSVGPVALEADEGPTGGEGPPRPDRVTSAPLRNAVIAVLLGLVVVIAGTVVLLWRRGRVRRSAR